ALDGEKCVFRIGDRLALGRLADELLAITIEGYDGGGGARPFRVLDHLRLLTFHHGDAGIGRSEVDPDDFSHLQNLLAADPGGSPLSGTSAPDFRGAGPQFKFGRAALISRETRRSGAI